MKIRTRLILGFLTVSLLVGLVGLSSVYISQQYLEKTIGENSILLAEETLNKIDRSIYARIEQLQLCNYNDQQLHDALIKSNKEFEELIDIQSYIDEKDKEWINTPEKEITPFMQNIINNELSKKLREKIEFYEKDRGYKVFGEIFITNKYGANIAQTGKTTDYYQGDEEKFQKAKENGVHVDKVTYDESAKIFSINIATKIENKNGEFLGVMISVFNIEEIINIVKEMETENRETPIGLKLLTDDGRIIYAQYPGYQYETLELVPKELQEHPHNGYFISDTIEPQRGELLFTHAHSNGYREYTGLGWELITELETKVIFAQTRKLRNIILFISSILVIISILTGIYLANEISKPLRKLEYVMMNIQKGKPLKKIKKNNMEETNMLIDSFNNMMNTLNKKSTQLERFTKLAIGREEKMIELKRKLRKNRENSNDKKR